MSKDLPSGPVADAGAAPSSPVYAAPNRRTGKARGYYVVPDRFDPLASADEQATDRASQSRFERIDVSDPSLDDLDVSVPYVECEFVAALVKARAAAKDELVRKAEDGWRQNADGTGYVEPTRWDSKPTDAGARDAATAEKSGGAVVRRDGDAKGVAGVEEDGDPEEDAPLRAEYEDGVTLLDLRTVDECTVWGMVEGAKCLPMHQFWEAFTLANRADFFEQYGFPMPKKDETLLLYCQHGPRSTMAAQLLNYLGYTNVVVLADGYYEWAKSYNRLVRRLRLLDHETGSEDSRMKEFLVAREIGRDIAPEFNPLVKAELDEIRVDYTRSRGQRELPVPPRISALAGAFNEERAALEASGATAEAKQLEGAALEEELDKVPSKLTTSPLRRSMAQEMRDSPALHRPTAAGARQVSAFSARAPDTTVDHLATPPPSNDAAKPQYPRDAEEDPRDVTTLTHVMRKLGLKKKKRIVSDVPLSEGFNQGIPGNMPSGGK